MSNHDDLQPRPVVVFQGLSNQDQPEIDQVAEYMRSWVIRISFMPTQDREQLLRALRAARNGFPDQAHQHLEKTPSNDIPSIRGLCDAIAPLRSHPPGSPGALMFGLIDTVFRHLDQGDDEAALAATHTARE